jgi:hypothetical protein
MLFMDTGFRRREHQISSLALQYRHPYTDPLDYFQTAILRQYHVYGGTHAAPIFDWTTQKAEGSVMATYDSIWHGNNYECSPYMYAGSTLPRPIVHYRVLTYKRSRISLAGTTWYKAWSMVRSSTILHKRTHDMLSFSVTYCRG